MGNRPSTDSGWASLSVLRFSVLNAESGFGVDSFHQRGIVHRTITKRGGYIVCELVRGGGPACDSPDVDTYHTENCGENMILAVTGPPQFSHPRLSVPEVDHASFILRCLLEIMSECLLYRFSVSQP